MDKEHKVKLEDLKPSDRENGYPTYVPRWYTRFFEILPGLMTWTLILFPFVAALAGIPEVIVFYVSFLTIYWSYRGVRFLYGLVVGYKRVQRDTSTDWMSKIKETGKEIPSFVYICPIVKEGLDVLEPGIKMWAEQEIGPNRISIIFALEEKYTDVSIPNCNALIEKYGKYFKEMRYEIHPYGIEGEVMGVKGANINYATRKFVKDLQERGENIEEYLLITCDSDMRPHPKYLSAITHKYLTDTDPTHKFFSTAIHTFNNNIWRVPPITRVFSHSITMAIFHTWVVQKHMRATWSSYVVNLKTVHDVGYWDPTIGIDDTPFYWNAKIRLKGNFTGEEVYVPTYNDAVENETFYKSHKSLYLQQLRWGWGIIVVPITFAGLYKNKDINARQKFGMLLQLIENQLLFLTVIYTITFSIPILSVLSKEYQFSSASYNLTKIMSYILTSLMFLNIPVYIIRRRITPPPEGWSASRKILDFFEIALITVNMLTFGFIPHIHAQTEMMFNRFRKKYYATEKVAIKS